MAKNSFVVDLETSGSDPDRFGVISCAALITNENDEVIDSYSRLVRPPMLSSKTWSKEAEQFHRISFEQVYYQGISNDQFCYELLCFLAKYKPEFGFYMPFICHASKQGKRKLNINGKDAGSWEIWPSFDWHFLERSMRKAVFGDNTEMVWAFNKIFHYEHSFISTVNMGRDAGYKKNRLDAWAERLRFHLEHHNALSDVYGCLEVYKFLKSGQANNDFIKNEKDEGIPF